MASEIPKRFKVAEPRVALKPNVAVNLGEVREGRAETGESAVAVNLQIAADRGKI